MTVNTVMKTVLADQHYFRESSEWSAFDMIPPAIANTRVSAEKFPLSEAILLMQMLDACRESAETGRSVPEGTSQGFFERYLEIESILSVHSSDLPV